MDNCLNEHGNTQYVRCLKCNKIISCPRNDTTKLIEHIRTDHPEVTVVESGGNNSPLTVKREGGKPFPPGDAVDEKKEGPNYTRQYDANTPNPMTKCQKGHLFRTSIERWRPANGTIYCPFCGCKKQPLVKMRNERLSGNSCTANCLLACWPFCFLPFLIPGNDKEYLYCANCKSFLGLYDRENNCIRPNRQFSERMNKGQCTECTEGTECPK